MVTELSILIPIYNQEVTALVHTLLAQCSRLTINFEIRLYDDASKESFRELNRPLAKLPAVVYCELPSNIGRAAIRNLMAQEALYDDLLLLDNDCIPISSNFLFHYLTEAVEHMVVIGGVAYVTEEPQRPFRLHWKYGKTRGARHAEERQKNPYNDIFLCNALLKKSLFARFPLRRKLTRYGHEDTIFAQELRAHEIGIRHIQNPVVHLGLEESIVLLQKTEQAVQNLVQLYEDGEKLQRIKLVQSFELLQQYRLRQIFIVFFSRFEGVVQQNLTSSSPNLLLFDFYRLYLFSKLAK